MRFSHTTTVLDPQSSYSDEIRGRDRYRKLQKALHYCYAPKLRYRKYFNEDKKKILKEYSSCYYSSLDTGRRVYSNSDLSDTNQCDNDSEEHFFTVK